MKLRQLIKKLKIFKKRETCRERLLRNYPRFVNYRYIGGCCNCPSSYGYLENPDYCLVDEKTCKKCWNRVIDKNA